MADGEHFTDTPATRRELDALKENHQRQIDDLRREVGEKVRDMRDELRRLSDAITKGMGEIAQKVERLNQAPPTVQQRIYDDAKKSGTPGWIYLLIVIAAAFLYLLARKVGLPL